MDKSHLHKIFTKPFNHSDWIEVLKDVFGARQLLVQPKPILSLNNDKAKAAYELGNFTTSDDRIIGLYKIELNDDVWLERNKVGLRELLRNVYKYDVDGAIIVFVQSKKWRLSFVSEIKVLNDEGEVVKQATEPKRYTYLLGEDEKVKTPTERLSKLAGKTLALNDILEAFSVEALNEEFYKIIAHYFYQLIGGKIGKGKKATDFGEGILQLPSVPKTNRLVYQEFAVRLIGRTIFSWFLKMKKSDLGKSLLPENLLSSKAVKNNPNYYHSILERLFFQTLNTKMEDRVDNLPKGCEQIPFLNGGLFEPDTDDYYRPNRMTGLSENINTLKIPDEWFLNFFTELEKYNFTIDENSVTDVEVSVDPEMLGRIFESLLAEIDPTSGETVRKATGSFYTPREIVDYMATESLVQYLHNKTGLKHEQLRPVFKMTEEELTHFSDTDIENILDALDKIKVLDPACGSGAFPMGVLQKIVMALQKLDPDATWWKERQIKRIKNQYVRKALREKLEDSSVEYAQKIGVIQNSLYGVDIQPIAAEISKLRCFLSLVVDETINENKPNRSIEPLPNLEFKFVTADSLVELPEQKQQRSLFDNYEELEKLEELRTEYLQSSGKKKEKIREQYINVQQKMFKKELHLFTDTQSRAYKLSSWNPFSHEKADWFDSKWMFGVEKFEIVIANPPYVQLRELDKEKQIIYKKTKLYKIAKGGRLNMYQFFIPLCVNLTLENGVTSFITQNSILGEDTAINVRKFLLNNYKVIGFNSFPERDNKKKRVFKNVKMSVAISLISKQQPSEEDFYINIWKDRFMKSKKTLFITIPKIKKLYPKKLIIPMASNESIFFIERVKSIKNTFTVKASAGEIDMSKYKDKFKDFHSDYRVFTGAQILRYKITDNPSQGSILYLNKDDVPYSNKFSSIKNKRICMQRITGVDSKRRLIMTIVDKDSLCANSTNYISIKNNEKLLFVLSILNSSLINYYFKLTSTNTNITTNEINSIPIPNTKNTFTFSIISNYILLLNSVDEALQINPHVPNTHIAQTFEEVIDAMVMELYFEEDFKKAGIEFIKYAERDFESIEGKPEHEQIEIIHRAYQKLREKDNEIRNNLKLMDIKLADIVMPIKTMK